MLKGGYITVHVFKLFLNCTCAICTFYVFDIFINKMKILMSGINNRLKIAEEKFNDLGYILTKSIQAKIHREKN